MSGNKIVYLDQVIGPISIDIINHFHDSGYSIEAIYGSIIAASKDINPNVNRIKLNKYKRSSTKLRILTWLLFFIRSTFRLLFSKHDYKLFAVSNPPLNIFTCYFLYKLFKVKYYLLVFDVYPETFIKYGYLNKKSWIVKLWNLLNSKSYQHAEKIYTLTPSMKRLIDQQYGKAHIIPIWADTESVKPIKVNENIFRAKYGLENSFIVLYSGNFGETHDIEAILDAAESLTKHSEIRFLFIGDGFKRNVIERRIRDKSLVNVLLLPFQEKSIFPHSLASADISIVTLDSRASEVSVPSKLFYNMAAGNSIISLAQENSELARLIKIHDMGINLDESMKDQLPSCILALFSDHEKRGQYASNARKASKNHSVDNVKLFLID